MDEDVKRAEEIARDYINELKKHISVDKAVIYGSYAKGTFNKYSDLDIAIFSKNFNNKKSIDVTTFLLSFARKYKEICIEPVGFSDTDLVDDNPFIKEIINTGKDIL